MNAIAPTQLNHALATANMLMERAVELAITEDLGADLQDPTTDSIVSPAVIGSGALYCKQSGVIVGLEVAEMILKRFDDRITLVPLVEPGTYIETVPTKIATFEGPAAAILKAERLALNLLQRMSGIATMTKRFVDKARPKQIQILDTRKTTPGLRALRESPSHKLEERTIASDSMTQY